MEKRKSDEYYTGCKIFNLIHHVTKSILFIFSEI